MFCICRHIDASFNLLQGWQLKCCGAGIHQACWYSNIRSTLISFISRTHLLILLRRRWRMCTTLTTDDVGDRRRRRRNRQLRSGDPAGKVGFIRRNPPSEADRISIRRRPEQRIPAASQLHRRWGLGMVMSQSPPQLPARILEQAAVGIKPPNLGSFVLPTTVKKR